MNDFFRKDHYLLQASLKQVCTQCDGSLIQEKSSVIGSGDLGAPRALRIHLSSSCLPLHSSFNVYDAGKIISITSHQGIKIGATSHGGYQPYEQNELQPLKLNTMWIFIKTVASFLLTLSFYILIESLTVQKDYLHVSGTPRSAATSKALYLPHKQKLLTQIHCKSRPYNTGQVCTIAQKGAGRRTKIIIMDPHGIGTPCKEGEKRLLSLWHQMLTQGTAANIGMKQASTSNQLPS